MHDPFLKSVLADHRMIEILIRDHVPEWADAIDFSTLRQEPTALVSKKTLQRRHPDMIWSAETTDAFMAERMDTMLELRDYPEELQLGGAKTMTEMVERFHRSLDELVQRGAREGRRQGRQQGRRQGRQQGQAMVLRRQIARRFGEETAGKVSEILEALPGTDDIDRVTDALFECGTGEEFIERVRTA